MARNGRDAQDAQQGASSQRMFGPRAGAYAISPVHVRDDSLDIIQRMASQFATRRCQWAADLGTGAGFTAFAMADYAHRVVATDPTRPMLEQARRLGRERGLTNLALTRNVAEALPFADSSLELVTSRVAGHHFADLDRAFDEVRRVLKVGGVLLMADSVAPEDDAVAHWMNDVELRRDFSHVKNRQVSELVAMLAARGMELKQQEITRVNLQFNDWVARTATAPPQVSTLRQDFLAASSAIKEAFQIVPVNGDIHFSWPCLVFRAVKE